MFLFYLVGALIAHISSLQYLGYVIVFCVYGLSMVKIFYRSVPVKPAEFFLLLLGAGSLGFSLFNAPSLKAVLYLVSFILGFSYLFIIRNEVSYKEKLLFIIISLLLASVPIFYQGANGREYLSSVYDNPNTLALVCIFPVYLLLSIRKTLPWWGVATLLLWFSIIIYGSGSRSVILLFFIVALVVFSSRFFSFRVLKLLCFSGVIIGLLGYYYIAFDMVDISRISIVASDYINKGLSLSGRDKLASIAMGGISDNFYGVGLGASGEYIENETSNKMSPHNTYLKLALEGGVFSLLVYFFIVIYGIFKSQSVFKLAFISAISIQCLFESFAMIGASLYSLTIFLIIFLKENDYSHVNRRLRQHKLPFCVS